MTARYTRGVLTIAGFLAGASWLHAQVTPLQILTPSLPPATLGAAYTQEIVTTGGICSGDGTPSSSIDAGALPAGISIVSPASVKQWTLQGIPLTAGNFSFTVHLKWTFNRVNPVSMNCVDEATAAFTLTVQDPSHPTQTLTVDRPTVTTTYHIGTFPPAADTVNVTSTGGVAAITVQSATDSGVQWMTATAQSSSTPAALSIAYSVSGLTSGTYTGHVTVTITGTSVALTIPVTLQVVTDSVQLLASPSSLVFSAVTGGADPPTQIIAVTVVGLNRLFQATVSAPPTGKWLSVTPTSSFTPATLTAAVTAKDLAAAVYSGSVTLVINGIPASSVTIPVKFTVNAPTQKPTIAAGGVVDAAGGRTAIAPGTWVSIFGTTLSVTTRAWLGSDFVNGRLPTSLDSVSVTIDGKPAAVAYISPSQINVLAADDTVTGLVPVVVKNALGASDPVLALLQTAAPSLFAFPGGKYAVGEHADGSLLVGPALVQQGFSGTAAHVGETIVLFGTGFGATQPTISATDPVTGLHPLARPEELSVRIGGVDATVAYAGLISPGLYQFNVVVPQVAAGDQPVVTELRGLLSQSTLLLTIQP